MLRVKWSYNEFVIFSPMNNTDFLKRKWKLQFDKRNNKEVAEKIFKRCINNLWYFSQEGAAFLIFDERLDTDTCTKLAEGMLNLKNMPKKVYYQV